MNRLARESSPYLLLHAHNPVDWHAWGEEAFERARREDKPIFLSVGYSTCYWCHVMERECFSDEGIAAQLNQGFVSVKLDREERPDLDEIYMTATQLLTRSGGWPNSLFLTHDLKPFFAGTYFPPQDRFGRPGFPRVLRGLREAWSERRADVLEQAEAVAGAIREQMAGAPPRPPGKDASAILLASLSRRFDTEWGGFGGAPKFPSPSNLDLLLDLAGQGEEAARTMLIVTLDRMARGGIQDQVRGGFHRYSTDAEWLVPHFEKMLYDNAALAALYAEADPLAPAEGFARVARRTLDFVLAEMTSAAGGFLSAIDAETDGHEGAYYTWSREELELALSGEELALAGLVHGLEGRATFEEDRYVPYLPAPLRERAGTLGLGEAELLARLDPVHAALLEARGRRKRPLVDDKVLTDWNGLMIGAMARCGRLLEEDRYVEAASRAAGFVLERLQDPASGLLHVYRSGVARIPAFLDDYAFLVHGLLELHEASAAPRWLREAVRVQAEQDLRLWDHAAGGYFNAAHDPQLMVQAKSAHDGAMASGNGVAALNLLRLASSTGDAAFEERARAVVAAFGRGIDEYPLAHVTLIRALRLLDRDEAGARIAGPEAARPLTAAAEAAVRVSGRLRGEGAWRAFEVDVEVSEGWHLNANPASLPFLVPTSVGPGSGAVRGVRYPEGERLQAASATDPLAIYRGRIRIEGELELREGVAPALRLTYQACDDLRCLPPVTREVALDAGS